MHRHLRALGVSILLVVLVVSELSHAEVSREQRVWPVGGTSQPDAHSSAFGPRLKISEDSRYDWHRGVDLPTPLNTQLVAVDDGVVRIAGSHPSYSDGVVQLVHQWDGVTYYTNYLHVGSSLVTEDQEVCGVCVCSCLYVCVCMCECIEERARRRVCVCVSSSVFVRLICVMSVSLVFVCVCVSSHSLVTISLVTISSRSYAHTLSLFTNTHTYTHTRHLALSSTHTHSHTLTHTHTRLLYLFRHMYVLCS
jgi:Peptidase family M23